jgi:hypothetical protein
MPRVRRSECYVFAVQQREAARTDGEPLRAGFLHGRNRKLAATENEGRSGTAQRNTGAPVAVCIKVVGRGLEGVTVIEAICARAQQKRKR